MSRSYFYWILLAALAILCVVAYLNFPSGHNQSNYQYFGQIVSEGGLPYLDFMDRRGPVGLYIYSVPTVLFGINDFAYRSFDLIVWLATCVLFFLNLRKVFSAKLSLGLSTLLLVTYIHMGPGNTADVVNLVLLLFLLLLLIFQSNLSENRKGINAGLLLAIAFWIKPTTALLFVFPIIYHVYKGKSGLFLQQFISFSMLSFIIPGLILHGNNMLSEMYDIMILDSITYYSDLSFIDRFIKFPIELARWSLENWLLTIPAIIGWILMRRKRDALSNYFLLNILACFILLFVESKYYGYHFVFLFPSLIFGLGLLINKFSDQFSAIKYLPIVLIASYCVLIQYDFVQFLKTNDKSALFRVDGLREQFQQRQSIKEELKSKRVETLFVLGSDCGIYNEIGVTTPFRFPMHGFTLMESSSMVSPPKQRRKWIKELFDFVYTQKPQIFVVDQSAYERMGTKYKKDFIPFVEANYHEMAQNTHHKIYELNEK